MSKQQPFSKLYHFYLSDTNLSASDKVVLAVITNYDNGELHCISSYEKLAETCGMTSRTVIRSVSNLEKLGYIHRAYLNSNNKLIVSNVPKMINELESNQDDEEDDVENDSPCQNVRYAMTKCHSTVTKCHSSYDKMSHNKNIYKNNIKEYKEYKGNATETTVVDEDTEKRSDRVDSYMVKPHSLSESLQAQLDWIGDTFRGIPINSIHDRLIYLANIFEEKYLQRFGKKHPTIESGDWTSKMGECIANLVPDGKPIAIVSEEDIDLMIDRYFDTNFQNCDYHFSHFSRFNVWVNRLHEVERQTGKPGYYQIAINPQKKEIEEEPIDEWWRSDDIGDNILYFSDKMAQ